MTIGNGPSTHIMVNMCVARVVHITFAFTHRAVFMSAHFFTIILIFQKNT